VHERVGRELHARGLANTHASEDAIQRIPTQISGATKANQINYEFYRADRGDAGDGRRQTVHQDTGRGGCRSSGQQHKWLIYHEVSGLLRTLSAIPVDKFVNKCVTRR